MKKKNAKLRTSNKPKYISKADREKMALEAEQAVNAESAELTSVSVEDMNDTDQDTVAEEVESKA